MPRCGVSASRMSLFLGLFALFLAIAGLGIEHGFGAEPCQMCWWQRYGHYAILIMGFLGWLRPTWARPLLLLMAVTAFIGAGIGAWQAGAQLELWTLPAFCGGSDTAMAEAGHMLAVLATTAAPVACDSWGLTIFGLSLAMWNVLAMGGVLVMALFGIKKG